MIGEKFNDLLILEDAKRSKNGKRRLKCKCICGNIVIKDAYKVKTGVTKSCGCKRAEYIKEARTIHNGRHTLLYSKWSGIKRRCTNKNDSHYKNYGALGINMCEEWQDFKKFQEWAFANGYDETLTIERKDVTKNYEPSNCIWIPSKYQAWTKKNSVHIIYKGKTQPLAVVAITEDINHKTLSSRYYRFVKRNPEVNKEEITFDMLIPR